MIPFIVKEKTGGFEIHMRASLTLVDRAVDEVKAFCKIQGLSSSLFAIMITMREGLTNAVRHGSSLYPDAMVRFSILVTGRIIHMEFEDDGPGFDWQTQVTTQSATNSEGGRGIEIMRRYCHNIVYKKQGSHLYITIHT